MCALSVLLLTACGGSSGSFQNKPRPPVPVNLTVYINSARVSVSPSSVGAGPVVFIVTNAAQQTESLLIQSADGSHTLANTGPINPQTTRPGDGRLRQPGGLSGGDQQERQRRSAGAALEHSRRQADDRQTAGQRRERATAAVAH